MGYVTRKLVLIVCKQQNADILKAKARTNNLISDFLISSLKSLKTKLAV